MSRPLDPRAWLLWLAVVFLGGMLVLALTGAHRDAVVAEHPRLLKRTYTVREFARVLHDVAQIVPGVVHVKYAYVNSICSGGLQLVDYYGGEFDPNDRSLRRIEGQRCSRESHDTGGDED